MLRARLLVRTEEHDKRNRVRSRFAGKVAFLDNRVQMGTTDEKMLPHVWEDGAALTARKYSRSMLSCCDPQTRHLLISETYSAQDCLDKYRTQAARVGLCLRPRRFAPKPECPAEDASPSRPANMSSQDSPAAVSAGYSSTEVRFLPLRHPHGLQGVLQVHQDGQLVVLKHVCFALINFTRWKNRMP